MDRTGDATMIFDKRKKILNRKELESLHYILSIFYNKSKPRNSDLNDALYLRMKINEILDNKQ